MILQSTSSRPSTFKEKENLQNFPYALFVYDNFKSYIFTGHFRNPFTKRVKFQNDPCINEEKNNVTCKPLCRTPCLVPFIKFRRFQIIY